MFLLWQTANGSSDFVGVFESREEAMEYAVLNGISPFLIE